MVYMKYVLSKTGWFPKWERGVEDVLSAASMVFDVKNVVTPSDRHFYYVILSDKSFRNIHDVLRLFRANGVILRPHRSHKYSGVVFRVPNHGQKFMRDVMRVNQDIDNFQTVLKERNIEMSAENSALLRKFREMKYRQY